MGKYVCKKIDASQLNTNNDSVFLKKTFIITFQR